MIVAAVRVHDHAAPLAKAYAGDAGIDLPVLQGVSVPPGEGVDVRSGWAVEIPLGFYGRIIGRSSAYRHKQLVILEGVIDSGFRGELFAFAFNPGHEAIWVEEGTSLAQLIVSPVPEVDIMVVEALSESERGERGFGSSGR